MSAKAEKLSSTSKIIQMVLTTPTALPKIFGTINDKSRKGDNYY